MGLSANRRLRGLPLDGIVQIQAEFLVSETAPLATYEDLTVLQALRHEYVEFAHLSSRARERRVDLQRKVYQGATACCTTTHWARASVIHDYGIPAERVHVVGIGTNGPPFADHEKGWAVPRFLFVGYDWERKNGAAVLRAFHRVQAVVGHAELHLVGGHPSVGGGGVFGHGPLRLDSINDRRRLWDLFRRATCFVMPSRVEPSAIAYLEAAACGVPSIGTTVGGSSELISDGGVVIDPGDEDALFQAMLRLCDVDTASRLGDHARRRARLYTWPAVARRILTALQIPGFDEPSLPPPQ